MTDAGLEAHPARSTLELKHKLIAVGVLAVMVTAAFAGPAFVRSSGNSSPFPPSRLHLHLAASAVPVSHLQATLTRLGIGDLQLSSNLPMSATQQAVVGRLSYALPAKAPSGSRYELFFIDERTSSSPSTFYGWAPGSGDNPGNGWDSAFDATVKAHAWLSPLAPIQDDSGSWRDPGTAVLVPLHAGSPMTFYASLDPDAPPIHDINKDVLVALAYIGPDGQPWWAQRLTVETALP